MRVKTHFFLLGLFLIANFNISAQHSYNNSCSSSKKHKKSQRHNSDIVDIASGASDFSTLVTAVKTAGLVETLQGDGPFTVFAPNNLAFDKLPDGTVASLLKPENKDALIGILTYHVVAGSFSARDVINAITSSGGNYTIPTVAGGNIIASMSGSNLVLKDEKGNKIGVISPDIKASNGIIHGIDTVLLPK